MTCKYQSKGLEDYIGREIIICFKKDKCEYKGKILRKYYRSASQIKPAGEGYKCEKKDEMP